MDKFTELYAGLMAQGASGEFALSQMRAAGASPIHAIKAIREVQMVNLGEAKRIFSESPAWSKEVRDGNELHAEILALIDTERPL